MKNLASDIFRQRLLIEGFYTRDLTQTLLKDYLQGVAAHLNLRAYGEPVIFSPEAVWAKLKTRALMPFCH